MLQVTEAIRAELLRRLPSEPLMRIVRDTGGTLQLVSGAPGQDDVVLLQNTEAVPVLVAAHGLADELDGAILHFRERPDAHWGAAGLTVLWPRGSQARSEPAPPPARPKRGPAPWLGVRSVFRRRVAAQSTTQIASP